ncbi:MAG: 2-isopropylmalate synthase [Gammaproteobacteria bacterium]|nr:2-isopropylmalate synthase [Gammaproteobacteria bacterium]MBU2677437.1 2-isopropylmalate synthase [Gammaproteobacteria bacterium]NNC56257.1 2-isopropylmalate synthase [Woeseiaceae bacterium]NNL51169.1 2-isopropylmalate synthase [Woeseiaceae bacterium]
MSDKQIRIFDTTLRDGEQAPGCSMTLSEKLRVAKALSELNVDIIEAGFPAASPGDFESVKAIADRDFGPVICGLARCNPGDIEKVYNAVKGAGRHRIHVFVATSAIHREHKLKMAKEEIIRSAVGAIEMARELVEDVEFSPEDASRTELSYLAEVVSAAIEAGATTVNIPDTVGYTVPAEFDHLFRYLKDHVERIDDIILSVHCHNDLGMAVANSLAAVNAGARQIECTINGIGERAGNCSLEEAVMAIKTRAEFFGLETAIDTTRLYPTSRLVSSITGMHAPRNKAIVGENAFAHEAGIHQHGMLQHASTYEIMRPEDVGLSKSNLVMGKHSGRHAFRDRVQELGFELDEFETNRAFQEFKKLADKKKDVYDGDIEAIIMNADSASSGPWTLKSLEVQTHTDQPATAAVTLIDENGKETVKSSHGDGPVAAAFLALEKSTGVELTLRNFELHSASIGEDAQGEVTVTVEYDGESYRGRGASVDIVEAGCRACLEVMNRILRRKQQGLSGPGKPTPEQATI